MQPRDWMQSPTHAKVNLQQFWLWNYDSALFLSLNTNLNSKKLSEFTSNAFEYISGCDAPLSAKCHFQNVFFKCIFLTDWIHIWAGFFFLSIVHDWSSVWAIHWTIFKKITFSRNFASSVWNVQLPLWDFSAARKDSGLKIWRKISLKLPLGGILLHEQHRNDEKYQNSMI